MDPVEITAGRLHLRPWEPRDAPEVFAICQDPEIQRWTSVPSPYAGTDAAFFVGELSPKGWEAGTDALFAVLDATTGAVLASVGLMGVDGRQGEVGYWAGPAARGRGVTTEAVGAVCRWAFGALGLHRVTWQAEVGNWPSRAVAEKCGFTLEGVRRGALPVHPGRADERLADGWSGGLLATDEVVDRRAFGDGTWRDLEGDGLRLRRWRDDDLAAVVAGLSDPEAARWLDVPVPYTEQDGRRFLEGTRARWADGVAAPLAVEVDGSVAGLVVLAPSPRDPGVAEVGWWTVPAARGRGVTARAVEAVVPWARELGLARLEASVDPENAASRRVAERAGMSAEGVLSAGLRPLRGEARRDGLLYARVLDAAPVR